ncbi:hypothetical protein SY89_02603 [Halolamina pelagica]|uniref:Uncharacterized protein n=1 Tax=Halolamina pelagica TaxID=699431 RepID=A0A0P7GSE9_9EURY|nr:hypothetical protein [Halolamina pelagica]KPN31847.1 hypothetical protein SY89_02603 [Halolamina pelagica]
MVEKFDAGFVLGTGLLGWIAAVTAVDGWSEPVIAFWGRFSPSASPAPSSSRTNWNWPANPRSAPKQQFETPRSPRTVR